MGDYIYIYIYMPYKALCLQVAIRWEEVDSGTVTLWPNGWGLEGKVHKSSDIQNSDSEMTMIMNIYIYMYVYIYLDTYSANV